MDVASRSVPTIVATRLFNDFAGAFFCISSVGDASRIFIVLVPSVTTHVRCDQESPLERYTRLSAAATLYGKWQYCSAHRCRSHLALHHLM